MTQIKKKPKYVVTIQFATDVNLEVAMHSEGNAVTSIILNKLALEQADHVAVLTNKRDYEAADVVGLQYHCVTLAEYNKQQPPIVQELTKHVAKLESQLEKLKLAAKSKAKPAKVVAKVGVAKKSAKKVTQLF